MFSFFLLIASHRKQLYHRAWSHCVQLIKMHRIIPTYACWPWGNVKVTWPEATSWLWPDEVISSYTYICRCVAMRGIYGTVIFVLALLVKRLWTKLHCPSAAIFFLPMLRHFLPDLNMICVKIVALVRLYPPPFTACLYLASFSRSPGDGDLSLPRRYEVGPDSCRYEVGPDPHRCASSMCWAR